MVVLCCSRKKGYQYRLCPASENLTEDCFAQHPLEFVRGSQALEWADGTRVQVPEPQYIDEGVIPVGATWARNPIPVISGAHKGCLNTTGNLTAASATVTDAGINGSERRHGQVLKQLD